MAAPTGLERRADDALFGYAVGPHSWKRFLHPARLTLGRFRKADGAATVVPEPGPDRPFAFIGVRSCDLHAIAIQDRVFLGGPYVDPRYAERRDGAFMVAVNCAVAGGTCFCVSMDTGPQAKSGYDIALTELIRDGEHGFLAESGSDRGAEILAALPGRAADRRRPRRRRGGRRRYRRPHGPLAGDRGIHDLLLANLEHPRWDEVAGRCLSCGNCTMVCPTCFCTSVEDRRDLDRREPSACGSGIPASPSTSPTSTAGASAAPPDRATASG